MCKPSTSGDSVMNQVKFKSYLEMATNVAVLLVALVVLGNFVWIHFAKKPQPHLEGGLRRGEAFPILSEVPYDKSSQTLLLALSSKCEHCSESIPFFKQLLETNAANGDSTQIIAVFPETADEVMRYVSEQQLRVQTISSINLQTLKLLGTPSAVLISSEGKILNFWIGSPSKDAEKEILGAIKRKV